MPIPIFFIQTIWAFYGNVWAKGDNLMETFYLKAHPFENRHPEWMPILHSNRGQDSNPWPGNPKTPKAQTLQLYHGGPVTPLPVVTSREFPRKLPSQTE